MMVSPPLGAKGTFVLKPPFSVDTDTLYTVIALRYFKELIANGIDVLNRIYQPRGLTQSDYEQDVKDGGTLVTLYSENGEMIFVPNRYILSFPVQSITPYANYVISAQIGSFKADYDFSFMQQKVAEVLSDTLGIEVDVNVDTLGEAQVMSENDIRVLEANRHAAINDRQTSYAKWLAAESTLTDLREIIRILQDAYTKK